MLFPEDGLVYDYQLQDGGVSNSNNDGDDDDEEGKNVEVNSWMVIFFQLLSLALSAYLSTTFYK